MRKSSQHPPNTEAAIWERIIHPTGTMSRAEAQRILTLDFSTAEQKRMQELAQRNRAGELAPDEEGELDNFCRVGNTLSLLKSRARQVLKSRARVS